MCCHLVNRDGATRRILNPLALLGCGSLKAALEGLEIGPVAERFKLDVMFHSS